MKNQSFILKSENYEQPVVQINSALREVVIISDLHLSTGLQEDNNYDGTENFFADESCERFIQFLLKNQKNHKTILVINGDFIDFIRIRHYPTTESEFSDWQDALSNIGMQKQIIELKNSISKKEKDFGLKTDAYKSVWKLHKCIMGHKILFRQLANWLNEGNQLVILKGNHDLEWYWAAVRDYLRYSLASFFSNATIDESNVVIKNLLFADDAVIIDGKIYIAHGHAYENITEVKGSPVVEGGTQLSLPFGSFLNRYLINRLELAYPFLDNVRPTQKILPLLIRERFPLALKYLAYYIPFTILIIPKKMYREVFKYLFDIFFIIILPVAITAYAIYKNVQVPQTVNTSVIGSQLINLLKNLSPLILSYFLGRILSMARLSSPPTFFPFAKKIFEERKTIKTVVFGHTHNPEQFKHNDNWYFNTGTWMPVYDISMADVRLDKTYTFLHIIPGTTEQVEKQALLRWNDDALRTESMILRCLK